MFWWGISVRWFPSSQGNQSCQKLWVQQPRAPPPPWYHGSFNVSHVILLSLLSLVMKLVPRQLRRGFKPIGVCHVARSRIELFKVKAPVVLGYHPWVRTAAAEGEASPEPFVPSSRGKKSLGICALCTWTWLPGDRSLQCLPQSQPDMYNLAQDPSLSLSLSTMTLRRSWLTLWPFEGHTWGFKCISLIQYTNLLNVRPWSTLLFVSLRSSRFGYMMSSEAVKLARLRFYLEFWGGYLLINQRKCLAHTHDLCVNTGGSLA
jgi:hypothetical protein